MPQTKQQIQNTLALMCILTMAYAFDLYTHILRLKSTTIYLRCFTTTLHVIYSLHEYALCVISR